MKQKYLSFVESRRSSQDSIEGRDRLSLDSVQSESSKGGLIHVKLIVEEFSYSLEFFYD
jgi:hypothetical protein